MPAVNTAEALRYNFTPNALSARVRLYCKKTGKLLCTSLRQAVCNRPTDSSEFAAVTEVCQALIPVPRFVDQSHPHVLVCWSNDNVVAESSKLVQSCTVGKG